MRTSNKQEGMVQDGRGQEQPASEEDARRGSATTRDKLANMGGDGLTEPDSDEDLSERLRLQKDPDRIESTSKKRPRN